METKHKVGWQTILGEWLSANEPALSQTGRQLQSTGIDNTSESTSACQTSTSQSVNEIPMQLSASEEDNDSMLSVNENNSQSVSVSPDQWRN